MKWTTSWWFLSLCAINGAVGGASDWPWWASFLCCGSSLAWFFLIEPHVRIAALERRVDDLSMDLLNVQGTMSSEANDAAGAPF